MDIPKTIMSRPGNSENVNFPVKKLTTPQLIRHFFLLQLVSKLGDSCLEFKHTQYN